MIGERGQHNYTRDISTDAGRVAGGWMRSQPMARWTT